MYILLISSTENEISPTLSWLSSVNGVVNDHEVETLITGVGSTATTYALTRHLLWRTPELVIQAGIGGSFSWDLPPTSVAFINEEVIADLGAIDNGELSDIFDLGLAAEDEHPFTNRMLVNPNSESWKRFGLPFVRGATINCISSTPEQVQSIKNKYGPVIESMEGAALHYSCIMEQIPFIQLRGVSNFVGERDKSKWKMMEAIAGLNVKLKELLTEM
ncbi:MAG: futalosine hydrolase [Chitinophagaceae bacterium]|nr:MAG: futalosine hydrolase [Chitinophagaceae bacterium]